MEKSLDFLARLCLGKPSNIRYLLALRTGGKHAGDLRATHSAGANAKIFEYMAITSVNGKMHRLTPNGKRLADALANLITITTGIMPTGGSDDRSKIASSSGVKAAETST